MFAEAMWGGGDIEISKEMVGEGEGEGGRICQWKFRYGIEVNLMQFYSRMLIQ